MVSSTSFKLSLAALAFGFAASAGSPAMAQSETLNSLLGVFGLTDDEKPEIEYRERAPLVVPPRLELRPPQSSLASRTQNWPADVDVVKARKKAAEARVPAHETETYRLNEGKPMSVYEMRAGRMAGAGLNKGPANPYQDELRAEFWAGPNANQARNRAVTSKRTELVAGEEPPRQYLTDPPPGTRAPSARGSLAMPKPAFQEKLSENQEASPYQIYRKPAQQ